MKKQIIIATQNPGKIREFQRELGDAFECLQVKIEDVVEDGGSYKANVTKKAKAYFEKYKIPVLADDSGIEIDALNGDPGVESAYFGGDEISWRTRIQYTLDRVRDFPKPWHAKYRCMLCYYDGVETKYFEASCEGEIVTIPTGDKGFGYDPLFYSYDLKKTFAEATLEEKAAVSHRGLAIQAFREFYEKNR